MRGYWKFPEIVHCGGQENAFADHPMFNTTVNTKHPQLPVNQVPTTDAQPNGSSNPAQVQGGI